MRVSYRWLQEFVPVELPPEELAERLTLIGLAVEEIERPWDKLSGVVVGRLTEVKDHPDSDHLKITQVDVGDGARHQIITGAPNTFEGMLVPAVLPGSRIADGTKIRAAKLRGLPSNGMCCSADELNLPAPAGVRGLLPLDPAEGWQPGDNFVSRLELDDAILNIELTPNYAAHCQSVLGVAREVAALLELPLRWPQVPDRQAGPRGPRQPKESPWPAQAGSPGPVSLRLEDDGCKRYVARYVLGAEVRPSPLWMQRRLQAAGMRPISNVVDVSNYIMLELGQPLHIFDLDHIRGGQIGVRAARAGERIETLDGKLRKLDEGDLVIADAERAVGVAGVMGGADSEVSADSRNLLIESAWFEPRRVGRTGRRRGLLSEAFSRFEKGVDPNGCRLAADRAAALIQATAGGLVPDRVEDAYPAKVEPLRLPFRPARIAANLGVELNAGEARRLLERLGFEVESEAVDGAGDGSVCVPTYRPDVAGPIDLVEEVGRLHGFNRIPSAPLAGATAGRGRSPQAQRIEMAGDVLRGAGFSEVLTYAFHAKERLARLGLAPVGAPAGAASAADAVAAAEGDERRRPIPVANPLSDAQEVMRTMLLPGLLDALTLNQHARRNDLALYEVGHVYLGADAVEAGRLPAEPLRLAFVAAGAAREQHWRLNAETVPADFYFAKGVMEAVAQRLRLPEITWCRADAREHPYLHAGRAALLLSGDRSLGWVGELHPDVIAAWELSGRPVAGSLDLDGALQRSRELPDLQPVVRHPEAARDLAVVLPAEVPAADVVRVIRESAGRLLRKTQLFDVYAGEHVGPGKRSLAYRLVYGAPDRTLTDDEVTTAHDAVRQALAGELGAVLRS